MNCQETRRLFEDALDRRLSGGAKRKFDLHLSRCRPCRDLYEAEQAEHARWFRALNAAEPPHSLPPDFADRLVAAVLARDKARISFFRRFRLPRWAGLAATLAPATAVSPLTWKTSSKKIAKVSKYGVVTPVKKGTCTITVKTNTGKTAKVKIKVVAALPAPTPTPTPAPTPAPTPVPETTLAPEQQAADPVESVRTTEKQDLIDRWNCR